MDQTRGARLPAEWEPQAAVMLTWPHPGSDWAEDLAQVYPVFAALGAAVSRHEALLSVCQSGVHAAQVRDLLQGAGADPSRLRFCVAASNDTWARDHGPLTVVDGERAIVHDFVFNGWGGKFDGRLDSAINGRLLAQGTLRPAASASHDLVLEGGAVETDGCGTLLATRASVLSATRNPGLDQAAIEDHLGALLGLDRFLWLEHGDISGDDTDGHIDTLARFADPSTILYATAPQGDADHPGLAAMETELRALRDRDGRPYRLQPLPFPGVHRDDDGRRLPATYANFLIINGAVLLPVYGVDADAEAVAVIRAAFPAHDVVTIDCRPIIRQNGSLHCLTMQLPRQLDVHDTLERSAA